MQIFMIIVKIKEICNLLIFVSIHWDFEIGLICVIKQVWPNSELNLYLWHLYRIIETNRNKIFGDIINHNQES